MSDKRTGDEADELLAQICAFAETLDEFYACFDRFDESGVSLADPDQSATAIADAQAFLARVMGRTHQ